MSGESYPSMNSQERMINLQDGGGHYTELHRHQPMIEQEVHPRSNPMAFGWIIHPRAN